MTLSFGQRTGGAWWRSFWLALLLLLALSFTASAQPVETSETSLSSSIEETLTRLRHSSQQLEKLLAQRKLKREQAERLLSELLQELATVRTALEESLEYSARSVAEIQSLTVSLELSEQTSRSLQTSFDEYVTSSNQAIRRARIVGTLIGAAGILIGIAVAIIF